MIPWPRLGKWGGASHRVLGSEKPVADPVPPQIMFHPTEGDSFRGLCMETRARNGTRSYCSGQEMKLYHMEALGHMRDAWALGLRGLCWWDSQGRISIWEVDMAREDPARDHPGVSGRAVDLFVVCLSQWGAKHWIACLDSHLLQRYPGAWKFPWDETKLCQTLNFFFFWLRIHCAKSMLCVHQQPKQFIWDMQTSSITFGILIHCSIWGLKWRSCHHMWNLPSLCLLFHFILDFLSLFEVLNALLKGWVDVYNTLSTVFDFLGQIF